MQVKWKSLVSASKSMRSKHRQISMSSLMGHLPKGASKKKSSDQKVARASCYRDSFHFTHRDISLTESILELLHNRGFDNSLLIDNLLTRVFTQCVNVISDIKMYVNEDCIINFALRVCAGYTEVGYSPPL